MDGNEYFVEHLMRERLAEARAAAARTRLAAEARRRPRLRIVLGTALIRAGAWLMRESYPATAR